MVFFVAARRRLLLVRASLPARGEGDAGPGAGRRHQIHQCLLLRPGAGHRLRRAAPRGRGRRRPGRLQGHRPLRPRGRHGHRQSGAGAPERAAAAAGRPAARPDQGPVSLRAPAAGLVTEVRTIVGAPASPQAGPMFRIAVNNEIELDAEVPAVHMLKLNPGATVRISRDDAPDLIGRVRLVSPQIDRATQLGHVRISRDQQSVAEDRHVRPRLHRRQAQLRRRRSAHRDRPSHRSGGQGQHRRDAEGAGRAGVRHHAKSSKASTSAKSSWPTPAPRCMTATRSRPCSPMNSIDGYADGTQYLGMVDPQSASLGACSRSSCWCWAG